MSKLEAAGHVVSRPVRGLPSFPHEMAFFHRCPHDNPHHGNGSRGRVVRESSLNKDQRRLLHDGITTGPNLSLDEIQSVAADIAEFNPKRVRN